MGDINQKDQKDRSLSLFSFMKIQIRFVPPHATLGNSKYQAVASIYPIESILQNLSNWEHIFSQARPVEEQATPRFG